MKFILFLIITVASTSIGNGQNKQEIIKNIRQEFQKINLDKNLIATKVDAEEFMENATDGGGELTGFKRNDSIVKIIEQIGISYGNRTREFYFKDRRLFFVYEVFDSFLENKEGDGLDYTKTKKAYEVRYYFNNGKLVEAKFTGKKPMQEDDSNPALELLEDAKEYMKLLSAR